MPQRLRLFDVRRSRMPSVVGLCQSDVAGIANYTNTAMRRLLFCREAGDEGWHGTWAEILFYVSQTQPYITLPREVARLESINICSGTSPVRNQLFEYLQFGNGRMSTCGRGCGSPLSVYSRNNAVTFTDLSNGPQYLSVFISDPADVGKRILFQGADMNGNPVLTQDGFNKVQGVFVSMESPFATTPMTFNTITGIQKDQTAGQVRIYQTDPTTGDQILLLTMDPSELVASYRRYFLNPLPRTCCPNTDPAVQSVPVTAIAKLDLIPVQTDCDYCLIQNLEAIINECQSARLSEVDNEVSQKLSVKFHLDAVRSLNSELVHYIGAKDAAINFSPFGTARLERLHLGMQ